VRVLTVPSPPQPSIQLSWCPGSAASCQRPAASFGPVSTPAKASDGEALIARGITLAIEGEPIRGVNPTRQSARMYHALNCVADVVRALSSETDAKVVVAIRRLLIPYLSRMTSKIEGRRSETTRNRIHRSAALFDVRRRSRNRPGPHSQGGDTGSNPVGTTHVREHVREPRGQVAPHWPRGVHRTVTAHHPGGRSSPRRPTLEQSTAAPLSIRDF